MNQNLYIKKFYGYTPKLRDKLKGEHDCFVIEILFFL